MSWSKASRIRYDGQTHAKTNLVSHEAIQLKNRSDHVLDRTVQRVGQPSDRSQQPILTSTARQKLPDYDHRLSCTRFPQHVHAIATPTALSMAALIDPVRAKRIRPAGIRHHIFESSYLLVRSLQCVFQFSFHFYNWQIGCP